MVEDEFKEGINRLLNIKGQSSAFDYDSYDWGCLRYMLELWILRIILEIKVYSSIYFCFFAIYTSCENLCNLTGLR
ncbi:MAG: hypothetical protein J7K81_01110, partial [Methanophagales archaeon]|nr:hypothetical protein [Methanophagales archaeon]